MNYTKLFSIKEQLIGYNRDTLRSDLFAGLTVGVMLVPQGMAYAYLAGVPPIYGLYAGLIPLLIYAILGTSRQMSIGPVAVSAILVASGISQIAEPNSELFISLAITLGLFIGVVQFTMGFFKMGFFANFLPHPVIAGFTSAAAIIIAISQLKDALGVVIPRSHNSLHTLTYIWDELGKANYYTLGIFFSSVTLILILKKINKKIPGAFIAVVLATLIVAILRLDQQSVLILGAVPAGLPSFKIPQVSWNNLIILMPTIITVTAIGIVESISIAKILESKHKNYKISVDKELIALGASKLAGAFFQAIPTSGSFSRSAVNSESGAKSTVASIITVLVVSLALVVFTQLFYYLPMAVLAAIIMLSVKSLFNYKEAIYLWKSYKSDFILMVATFMATLTLGIETGVLFGVVLSLIIVLYKATRPHITVLGNIRGTHHYRNVNRFAHAAAEENTLIIRLDNQLFFGNCAYFRQKVDDFIEDSVEEVRYVVIDARNIHDIDSSGMHVLRDLDYDLKAQNIELHLAEVIGPVRDSLHKAGLLKEANKHHMSVRDAMYCIKQGELSQEDEAMQTNVY